MKNVLRLLLPLGVTIAACGANNADPNDFSAQTLTSSALEASPTNAHADDANAAALGRLLFFDLGFSSDGTVGCVSCHDPNAGFSDARSRSVGVRGQTGDRHSMPVTASALHPFLFWDGRVDSVWSQPLKALENPKEMDFTRVEVARRMTTNYGPQYAAIFGALPSLADVPARATPGDAAWSKMSTNDQTNVNRVFSNVGKAIEAYERKLLCTNTRFDRWVRGEDQLSDSELAGGGVFQNDHCNRCHAGPSFSDGLFHDIGIPSTDQGRTVGATELLADPFNGIGMFSDDATAGATKLALVSKETAQLGAFRTASLRGVGQRTFFGHASHQRTLRGFIEDIYRNRGGGGGGRTNNDDVTVGTRDPLLNGVNVDDDDLDDLVAFLHTLDCPTPSADLLDPAVAQ